MSHEHVPLAGPLSSAAAERYREVGFTGPLRLLERETVTEVCARVRRVLGVPGLAPAPAPEAIRGRLAELLQRGADSPVPFIECRHLDSRTVHGLVSHPALVAAVASIYGPDLLVWRSTLIDKFAGGPEIRWHQDFGGVYARGNEYGLEPPFFVNAVIALEDATRDNGGLCFVPGTRAVIPGVSESDGKNATPLAPRGAVAAEQVEPVDLRAGEMMIFTDRVLHASPPNTSARDRLLLFVRLTWPMVKVRSHFAAHRCLLVSGKDALGLNPLATPPTGEPW